ncbi:hypothetical protein [Streptomyces pseudogriseolus]|nr:hypothetical protein [Streptomyces gancidicus]
MNDDNRWRRWRNRFLAVSAALAVAYWTLRVVEVGVDLHRAVSL